MQARATAKGIRIAPRKVRLVLDNVRNKDVSTALAILQNTPRFISCDLQIDPVCCRQRDEPRFVS